MSDVTQILSQIDSGDPAAASQLLPLVYDELRKLASAKLAREKPGQTLQPTALVHEAFLRLVGRPGVSNENSGCGRESGNSNPTPDHCPLTPEFDSRGHFFAAAAEAMRRILVEQARRKARKKRGGDIERRELAEVELSLAAPSDDVLALDEALSLLAIQHPEKVPADFGSLATSATRFETASNVQVPMTNGHPEVCSLGLGHWALELA